ncbi:hypothetical protein PENTCL1PPCAC_4709, partial [Pristionchus entomophagus]
ESKSTGATVHYKNIGEDRYFAGRIKIGISAKDLMTVLYHDVDKTTEWNENVKFAKRLHKLTEHTDIVTMSNHELLIIKSRVFVAARCTREALGGWVMAGRSIELKELPVTNDAVRAFLNIGFSRAMPDPEDPEHSCIFDNVVCIDLQKVLLKSAVKMVLGRINLKDLKVIRNHCNAMLSKQ